MNRALTVGILAMFVVAGLLPVAALAKEGPENDTYGKGRGPPADKTHGAAAESKGRRDAVEARAHKPTPENFTIALSGTATGRNNTTYTIEVSGNGTGHRRGNETNAGYLGMALVHLVVRDANGTVVKEGDVRAKVTVKARDDGNFTWHLEAVKKKRDLAKFNLRGNATPDGNATFDLAGAGHLVVKKDGERRALPLRVSVTGEVSRS
ncbi:MAG: hypothetical protein ACT4PT_03720 [Methanobacteriota archaeon]